MNMQLTLWLAAINTVVGFLMVYSSARFPGNAVKWTFISLLGAALLYANPVLLFWNPDFDPDLRLRLARMTFTGALILANALAAFLIVFFGDEKEFRTWRYALFQTGVVVFLFLNAGGFVVEGLATPEKLQYGFAHVPLVFFIGSTIVFLAAIGIRSYRRCSDLSLRFQIRVLLFLSVATGVFVTVNNGVIPAIAGSSQRSPSAVFALTAYFGALAVLVTRGQKFEVLMRAWDILKRPEMRPSGNLAEFRRMLGTLELILEERPEAVTRVMHFQADAPPDVSVQVAHFAGAAPPAVRAATSPVNAILAGLQKGLTELQSENLRLGLIVDRTRELFDEVHDREPALYETLQALIVGGTNRMFDMSARSATGLTPLEQSEKRVIARYLQHNNFNQSRTRKELGISVNTLRAKAKKYGIDIRPAPLVPATQADALRAR